MKQWIMMIGLALMTLASAAMASADENCKMDDACRNAIRAQPLHPATVGEEIDAGHAVDVACAAYRACLAVQAAAEAAKPAIERQEWLRNCKASREAWNAKNPSHPVSTDCTDLDRFRP